MKNIWRLFVGDLRRLGHNTITAIIVLGLITIPSLFSWYNLIACWNVFDNTGNLTVAVANTDEGYVSDLVPIEVNIGDQVVSELRANDQLNWVFTDEEDAIDGAKSGRYYAAVVIPTTFSQDMMTFYSDDVEHAKITYYTNQKKNAIAPKVTDQGADGVSNQVNQVFAETLSDVALSLASALSSYMDDSDLSGRLGDLNGHIGNAATQMDNAASTVSTYAAALGSAQTLLNDSSALLAQVGSSADSVSSSAGDIKDAATSIGGAVGDSATGLSAAISQSAVSFGAVGDSVDAAFDAADQLAFTSATQLRTQADNIDAQIADYRALATQLETIKPSLPSEGATAVDRVVKELNASIVMLEKLRDALYSASDDIEAGGADTQAKRDEIKQLAQQAQDSLNGVKTDYNDNLAPKLDALASDLTQAGSLLSETDGTLEAATSSLTGAADSVSQKIGTAKQKLDDAATELHASADRLAKLNQDLAAALASGDTEMIKTVLSDPSGLADALSAPVQLDRHAIYPVNDFGSAMTPLYTTIALWVGALLTLVVLKANPSRRIVEELDNPSVQQLFLGRFGVVAVVSLAQSTLVALGNMLFLGVQTVHPFLFMVCYWVSGLVFAFIIYTLVVSFANLGKAIAVFLLVIQVSGGGGSYPLPLLPDFVQALSPYLPVTHAVNAMRAAMFGVYNGDFWMEIGILLLFTLPFILIGLVLRNPLIKVINGFVEKVESSKVM